MRLIRRICHVAIRTPDLASSVSHATGILGLRETDRIDGVVFLTSGDRHHELQLIPGAITELDHIGLEATSLQALDEIRGRLVGEETTLLSDRFSEPGLGTAIRFSAPSGHVFEVHDGMAVVEPADYNAAGVRPRKLGHVTVNAPQLTELQEFLERVLGFLPSDRLGADLVWMRCNADHHGLAIARASAGLRHVAWELENWGYLEVIADHLMRNHLPLSWGPGRHGPGNNLACYHVDPVGVTHEHLCDLQQIYDDDWRGRDWEGVANWRNLWGAGSPGVRLPAPRDGQSRRRLIPNQEVAAV